MTPVVGILTIGDELLNGSLVDSNSAVIADRLAGIGLRVSEGRTLPDDAAAIAAGIRQLSQSCDILILTGGLGPTEDDLTAACIARAFDRPCSLNEQALALIDDYCRRRGRPRHPRDRKSAELPVGATPLPNPCGTAPGIHFTDDSLELFALPGVPPEMLAILETAVLPHLQQRFRLPPLVPERILSLFGIAEPQVEAEVERLALPDGVSIAFGVSFPLVQLKLRAAGPDAAGRLDQAVAVAQAHFAAQVVARDRQTPAERTGELLRAAGRSLALAESCTGGLISALLTDVPGASSFLERAGVTYANSAKRDWLGVDDQLLERDGAVSATCAEAMATGIRAAAGTDFGLAVTGIAGPDGGSADKPVGTVFIALADADGVQVERHQFPGDRQQVRQRTAYTALALLQRRLDG